MSRANNKGGLVAQFAPSGFSADKVLATAYPGYTVLLGPKRVTSITWVKDTNPAQALVLKMSTGASVTLNLAVDFKQAVEIPAAGVTEITKTGSTATNVWVTWEV